MATLWPFCPDPTVSEVLQFSTDVIACHSTEQRARLSLPRHGHALRHRFAFPAYERAKLLFERVAGGAWTLPLWREMEAVTVAAGASTIATATTFKRFQVGEALVLWASESQCEVATVAAIAPALVTLAAPIAGDYAQAWAMPGVDGYAPDGLETGRTVQRRVDAAATFWHYSGADLSDAAHYATYRGHPLVDDAARVGAGSFTDRAVREVDIQDNQLSLPYFDQVRAFMQYDGAVAWMPRTLAELWPVRRFLHYAGGMWRGFWSPDWTRGLAVLSDLAPASTSLTVAAAGFDGVADAGDVFLKTTAGDQVALQYTGATLAGDVEVLTLAAPAGVTIAAADLRTACLLRFVRLASDRIELVHQLARRRGEFVSSIQAAVAAVPIP